MKRNGEILIVEDDEDDRDYIELVFSELGIVNKRVYMSNAYDALDYIRNHDHKTFMIISDINMPRMNGFELREAILAEAGLSEKCTPYIFLSTSGDEKWVNKAFKLSVQGYFKKPSVYNELKVTVQQIVDYWNNSLTPSIS
jgi:CheY-like chemotaxis protein